MTDGERKGMMIKRVREVERKAERSWTGRGRRQTKWMGREARVS